MNRMLPAVMRCVLAVALATAAVAQVRASAHDPYVPASDELVLEHIERASKAGNDLRNAQRQLAQAPEDLPAAIAFARSAIERGNEEGDPRFFGYAESALAPWWRLPAPSPEARILRATILQWRHDFDAANRDLDAVIAADGNGVEQARLIRADLKLVQGDPGAARQDCARLVGRTDALIGVTCIASANALMGRAPAMEEALAAALVQLKGSPISAQLWASTALAEIAVQLGNGDVADRAYAAALALAQQSGHRDPYLLASYADHLLSQDQPEKVVAMLSGLARIDNLLLRLALAEDAMGRRGDSAMAAQAQQHARELQQRFYETRERGDFVHQREEAIYLLKLRREPAKALAVAQENWRKQRELTDARVLLEAAAAAHEPQAADEVIAWMHRWGLQDVRLVALATELAGSRAMISAPAASQPARGQP